MEPRCLNVLVIEDDPSYARLLSTFLIRQGHNVRVAEDGIQGQLMARTEKPDLITLDHALPAAWGTSVCSRLRNSSQTADIPVVMLTGSVTPELEAMAAAAGVDVVLSKLSLTEDQLTGAIDAAVGGRLAPAGDRFQDLFPADHRTGDGRTARG